MNNNKLKVIRVILTSYFPSYSIVLYYTIEIEGIPSISMIILSLNMEGATLMRNYGSRMPKQSDDSYLQENQEP